MSDHDNDTGQGRNAAVQGRSYLLIYRESIATWVLGIQFARLSGYTLIAICSPHNFGLVRQMGAEAVFDYADREEAANYIREYTNKMLTLA